MLDEKLDREAADIHAEDTDGFDCCEELAGMPLPRAAVRRQRILDSSNIAALIALKYDRP
jgi:hypothetical protein